MPSSLNISLNPNEISRAEWYLNGIALNTSNVKYEIQFEPMQGLCSLVVNNVAKNDCGEYTCRVYSNFGEHSTSCLLKIQPSKQGLLEFY